MKDKIALTIGNPNGIGPEISLKALGQLPPEDLGRFTVITDSSTYESFFSHFSGPEYFVLPAEDFRHEPGKPNLKAGLFSYRFIEKAAQMAKSGNISGIVTAPISKEWVVKAGFPDFVDHTTYLGSFFGTQNYSMLFYSENLKVLLATIHVPLKEVSTVLTRPVLERAVRNSVEFCRKIYGSGFRIALCGINPHAGENGLLGHEENELMVPVVEEFQSPAYKLAGPLPADTVFYKAFRGEFDFIIAAYHDQGLAPFKMLHFQDGVNMTYGLPVVRTSPDHGTAFDIAGKGIADASSMLSAIKLAMRFVG